MYSRIIQSKFLLIVLLQKCQNVLECQVNPLFHFSGAFYEVFVTVSVDGVRRD